MPKKVIGYARYMPKKLVGPATYRRFFDEDIAWLLKQPRSASRSHIEECLRWLRVNRHVFLIDPKPQEKPMKTTIIQASLLFRDLPAKAAFHLPVSAPTVFWKLRPRDIGDSGFNAFGSFYAETVIIDDDAPVIPVNVTEVIAEA